MESNTFFVIWEEEDGRGISRLGFVKFLT